MKVKPLGKRILLKKLEDEAKTSPGGIVLPDSAKSEKVVLGQVLEVGSDKEIEVKKNDQVLVPSFSCSEIEMDGEKLLIVKSTDVLAVVKNK